MGDRKVSDSPDICWSACAVAASGASSKPSTSDEKEMAKRYRVQPHHALPTVQKDMTTEKEAWCHPQPAS